MKRVKIAELKSQLSKHLRAVEAGAEIEVTDRERPIARIVPASRGREASIELAEVSPETLRGRRERPARWPVPSLTLLLRDRSER